MRRIFLLMNTSLDGYFEGLDHDLSWSTHDFVAFSTEASQEVDTLLFGRRTYNLMKSFWPTPQGQQMAPEIARFMNERHKVVASRTLFDPGWQNVTVISEDVISQVKHLKEQSGKTIAIFGSNALCVSLMPHGLIDEFQILVNPVVLGKGTPLFQGLPHKIELRLTTTQSFENGVVMLTYSP